MGWIALAHALLKTQGMAMISPGMRACVLLSVMLFAACNKESPTAPSETALTPAFVVINGSAPAPGGSAQFTATAIAADGARADVTAQATWASSDMAVLTVVRGMVSAVSPGSAQLTASYAGVTGAMGVVVTTTPCQFDVTPRQATIPGLGGSVTISVRVTSGGNCAWTAQASDFLTIVGSGSGAGSGTLLVSALGNAGSARVGTVSVGGVEVSISQEHGECITAVTPTTQAVPREGGSFVVSVNAPAQCRWMASTDAEFITVSRSVAVGPGDVLYQIAANPNPTTRQTLLMIGRFQVMITQAASTDAQASRAR